MARPLDLLRKIRHRFDEMLLTQRDAVAMAALAPLSGPFIPVTRFSMRPSGILALVNEIALNRRRCIVECGPGLSTIYMARALRAIGDGGVLVAVDHDARWLDVLRRQLRAEDLERLVELVHAPLVSGDWGMGSSQWYDPTIVATAARLRRFDLVVVDGPVASDVDRQYARFPAVPILAQWFDDSVGVVLDDINRAGEQAVLAKWQALLGTTFDCQATNGRIAVAHIGRALAV